MEILISNISNGESDLNNKIEQFLKIINDKIGYDNFMEASKKTFALLSLNYKDIKNFFSLDYIKGLNS